MKDKNLSAPKQKDRINPINSWTGCIWHSSLIMSPSWYFEPTRDPYQNYRYSTEHTHLEKRLLKINIPFIFPLKLKKYFKKTSKNWKISPRMSVKWYQGHFRTKSQTFTGYTSCSLSVINLIDLEEKSVSFLLYWSICEPWYQFSLQL